MSLTFSSFEKFDQILVLSRQSLLHMNFILMSLTMRPLFNINAINAKITIVEFSSFFAEKVTCLLFTFLKVFIIFVTSHIVMAFITILSAVFSHFFRDYNMAWYLVSLVFIGVIISRHGSLLNFPKNKIDALKFYIMLPSSNLYGEVSSVL